MTFDGNLFQAETVDGMYDDVNDWTRPYIG